MGGGTVPGCPLQEAGGPGRHAPLLSGCGLSGRPGLDTESTPMDQMWTLPVGIVFSQGQRLPGNPLSGWSLGHSQGLGRGGRRRHLVARLVDLEQEGASSLTSHLALGMAQNLPKCQLSS